MRAAAKPPIPLRLHDEIVNKLRGMILRCELLPGSRVAERELCERFGISRTPLREAMKVLAASGLVELWPNRGVRIAPLRPSEIADVFDVLALIEKRAGELAGKHLDARGIAKLRRLQKRLAVHAEQKQQEAMLKVDLQIHRIFVEAAGSPTLLAMHDSLTIKVERARYYIVGVSPARANEAVKEHERILEATIALDARRLADELQNHCVNTRDAVVSMISTWLPADVDDLARRGTARPLPAAE